MRSAHALMAADPVLAAGIGVRRGGRWAVRAASFRIGPPIPGKSALGIQVSEAWAAAALVDVVAGSARLSYGELRVLGFDMTTAGGRAAVRHRVGVARRNSRLLPGVRVRGLVEHAARLAVTSSSDRHLLAAAILDRLALRPWAEVPVRLAPAWVGRRARLAAAAVHQPELLLLDGLLDGLPPRDVSALGECVNDLGRDSGILVTGRDGRALGLACDEILLMSEGVLVSG
jgi:ABC-2 type transport system ATP-binding protein